MPDFWHFGTDMNLPYLPYAFTGICALCGKYVGNIQDHRGLMSTKFLQSFLSYCCISTPFVFNILYQMAFYPELEEEALRLFLLSSSEQHPVQQHPVQQHPVQQHPVQQHIYCCMHCLRFVEKTCRRRPVVVGSASLADGAGGSEEEDWILLASNPRNLTRSLIPMDQIFYMVYFPELKRTLEYRMTVRLFKSLGGEQEAEQLGNLYRKMPFLYMKVVTLQVQSGTMQLKVRYSTLNPKPQCNGDICFLGLALLQAGGGEAGDNLQESPHVCMPAGRYA